MQLKSLICKNYTFKNLVRCSYNEHAIDSSLNFVAEPDPTHLIIDSSSGNGDGMSHLMHALGHQLLNQNADLFAASAERLFMSCVTQPQCLKKLLAVDWLLIDDINFLLGKQDALINSIFAMLAARTLKGQKTLFTCAIKADELELLQPNKHLNFLYSGSLCRLESPSLTDKFTIAKSMCQSLHFAPHQQTLTSFVDEAQNIRHLANLLTRFNAVRKLNI